MSGTLKVYVANDEAVEALRETCDEEGVELLDMRTPWRRLKHYSTNAFFVLLALYFFIAHYRGFKEAMGWAVVVLPCS